MAERVFRQRPLVCMAFPAEAIFLVKPQLGLCKRTQTLQWANTVEQTHMLTHSQPVHIAASLIMGNNTGCGRSQSLYPTECQTQHKHSEA